MKLNKRIIELFALFSFLYALIGDMTIFKSLNLLDEIVTGIMLIYIIYKFTSEKFNFINKFEKLSILCIGLLVIIGIGSSCFYRIQGSVIAIIKDIVLVSKFFIVYFSAKTFFDNTDLSNVLNKIKKISKVYIVICMICAVVSLFVNIGMGSSVRYGIRSFQFLFPHYTFLVYSICIAISSLFISFDKLDFKFLLCSFFILVLTLRTKAIIYILMVLFLIAIGIFSNKIKIKKTYFIFPILAGILVSGKKIVTYITWGTYNLRVGLHLAAFKIANDFFPFGSGLGTFGSNLSREYNSSIYISYNLIGIQGLNSETADIPISDVFWPYILGQWGYFGFILYCIALLMIVFDFLCKTYKNNYKMLIPFLSIFSYFIIASFAEAIFTNSTGVSGALVLALYCSGIKHDQSTMFSFCFLDNICNFLKSKGE